MSNEGRHSILVLSGIVTFAMLMFVIGVLIGNNGIMELRKEAVKLGHAEYNQTTGVWQWKELK